MLIALRSKGASWVVKGLFVILIISFAWWGVPDVFQQLRGTSVAASVGDYDISIDELRKAVDFKVKGLQRQSGGQLSPEIIRQLGVPETALDEIIERRLLSGYAESLDMSVPDDLMERALERNPDLVDSTGNLDPRRLEAMIREFGLTQAEFAAVSRRDVLGTQIIRAATAGSYVPKSLAEIVYAYRNEQRVAETLVIPDSSITDLPTPDEAALIEFHKQNEMRYQAPEYRGVTLVRLSPADYAKQIGITDEAARAEYDARLHEFDIPEKRLIVQAVLPDEAAAKDLAAKVRSGTGFADAVAAATGAPPVEVGLLTQGELQDRMISVLGDAATDAKIADALFSVAVGEVTDPVKGPIGWHVLSPSRIDPPSLQSFESVRDKLKEGLALQQATDGLIEIANQFDDEMGAGADLTEAAEKLALPVFKIAAVDSEGKAPDGKEVPEFVGQVEALKAAFDTEQGNDSPMTDTADGGYVVVHVDSIQPAATKALDSIRATVITDWQAEERKKLSAAKASAIIDRIKGGDSIGRVAHELGVPVLVTKPFTRASGEPEAGVSGALATKLFAAKIGEAATDRTPADDGVTIAVLREIKPVDPAQSSEGVAELQRQLARPMGSDLYEQLSADLMKTIGVSKDQDVIEQLSQ